MSSAAADLFLGPTGRDLGSTADRSGSGDARNFARTDLDTLPT